MAMAIALAAALGAAGALADPVAPDGFYLVVEAEGIAVMELPDRHGGSEMISAVPLMSFTMVARAEVEVTEYDSIVVLVDLTPAGAALFGKITGGHVDERLAIVVDGVVLSAPVIREPIRGGRLQIDGGFQRAEAEALAARIGAGVAP